MENKDYHMKPYTCPVCGGKGTVPSGFYDPFGRSSTIAEEQCKSCYGRGVLWG